ncbi:MAG: RNase adapter RapZ, partial [Bacteroidales bacterium]|nr:RNase adapter RapZ [Bacteroidales bacterium]
QSFIGSYNPDTQDHKAFLYLAKHFYDKKLAVPQVFEANEEEGVCLLQDLGNNDLLAWLEDKRSTPDYDQQLLRYYRMALVHLLRFQLDGSGGLNYQALPVHSFNKQAMHWDLNYFKYYFLKPSGILFDESSLENDFQLLVNYLSEETLMGFMYRDFQARNIMIHNDQLYFIDFQGGRYGPLQYDVVSLLFQAKAAIPFELRQLLLDFYIERLQQRIKFDEISFRKRYSGFVLLRVLQVMGAYGFRGWFERKAHFLASIALLEPNMQWILDRVEMLNQLPEIKQIIFNIKKRLMNATISPGLELIVTINSFSFRRGIPYDPTGNGGGFVFDCRLLPNPGLLGQYKNLTGLDHEVKTFLSGEPTVLSFVDLTQSMVLQAVENYQKACYTHLHVSFGCTGGQHRSVYCAQALADALDRIGIKTKITHQELKNMIS